MATNTQSYSGSGYNIPQELTEWIDKVYLVNTRPKLLWNLFADRDHETMPLHEGTVIRFDRLMSLPVALTPLTVATTPAADDITMQKVNSTIHQYGSFLQLSDYVDLTNDRNPWLTRLAKLQSTQIAETKDTLAKNVLIAGASATTCDLSLGTPSSTTLDAALATARSSLLTNNAEKISEVIKASTGVGTVPIAPAYFAICHTDILPWLESDANWTPVQDYPSQKPIREGEMGAIGNVRFLLSTNGDATYNAGSAGSPAATDVYNIIIFAQHAYATTRLAGGNLSSIINQLGSGGATDPLSQRGSLGWKMFQATEILDDRYMYRITATVVA